MGREGTEPDVVRLGSSELAFAPGLIPYVQRVWPDVPENAIDVLTAWEMPAWCIPVLLAGQYEIDGDVVVVRRPDRLPKTPETRQGRARRR